MLAAKDKAQLIDALPPNVAQRIELQPLGMMPAAKTEAQLIELQPLGMMPAANTEEQLVELQPLSTMPAANTEDQQPLQTAGVLLKDKLQWATSEIAQERQHPFC